MTRTSTRNINKPVRYSEESEKYLKGRYHGWKDTWDRNYNGHINKMMVKINIMIFSN